ncbi:sushi, von Willebrand factor type A, EGF and pentraxin domain-containing protein 1 [Ixodes scapularis]|uniref:sushi, von Willebrand factor type A, EGF and pentraxin domain-containing protein 1 n=1 Tax=Ixodes scapularis TaxID=6945 RepID=UPI001A9FFC5A|nr:sushi, von Willebrand factor type A, EGF and pentraxin domain-containing protein 1 [Ixodes scapularis]
MRCNRSCANPSLASGVNVVRQNAAEMRFACQSNLALEGPEQIHCSRTGEWDAKPPVCVQPQTTPAPGCDVTDFLIAAPSRVVINASASEAALGAVFEAFCDDKGYILEGRSSRVTCKANGMWDFDAKMTCVKGCTNFADQDERLVIEGFLPKYYLGDSITLSCPNGTKLDPHVERITCLGDGWSETELPRCSDTEQENPKQKTRGSSKSRVSGVRKGGR